MSVFTHLHQAVNFYNNKNPARAKYVNLLEPESRGASNDYLGEYHPNDVWCSVCGAINYVLTRNQGPRAGAYQAAYIGNRDYQKHPADIAGAYGVSIRTIYRWLERINDELESELIKRELLEPEKDD